MKRQFPLFSDSLEDHSELEIRRQVAQLQGDSFDMSHSQAKGIQFSKYISNFPVSNAPTLQNHKEPNIRYLDRDIEEKEVFVVDDQERTKQIDIDEFCVQLLSPEENVELLYKLLKKIDKSAKMKKRLARDEKIKQIMIKILKSQ